MFKIHKKTFFRLYRYYLKKLLLTWLFLSVFTLILVALTGRGLPWSLKMPEKDSWGFVWTYSLIKLGILLQMSVGLISLLVQRAKIEDAWILTTRSPVNRQSILAAKLASFYTYYFGSSLVFINLSVFSDPLFLLFDWFLLALVNFLLFLTPIFYLTFPARSKIKKFLILFLYAVILLGILYLSLNNRKFGKFFVDSPWVSILLSILIGPFFLYLFWDNFRQHDY